ncbi:MAG: hypothetical protein SNJ74_00910 [Fimbriimonadaceae bacterium]
MPHIHLHTSADLVENTDIPEILTCLADRLAQAMAGKGDRVRAYHTLHNNWVTGTAARSGFAHVEVVMRDGDRTPTPDQLSELMLQALKELFRQSIDLNEVELSAEVRCVSPTVFRSA